MNRHQKRTLKTLNRKKKTVPTEAGLAQRLTAAEQLLDELVKAHRHNVSELKRALMLVDQHILVTQRLCHDITTGAVVTRENNEPHMLWYHMQYAQMLQFETFMAWLGALTGDATLEEQEDTSYFGGDYAQG